MDGRRGGKREEVAKKEREAKAFREAEASPLLIITAWLASERAPVKHPSSRRMAPLPITSAVIANFSRSSSLACLCCLSPPLPPSLSRPSFCPCLVARLLDHPQQPTRRQLRLFRQFSVRRRMDLSLSLPFLLFEGKNERKNVGASLFIVVYTEISGKGWLVAFNCSNPFRRAYGTSYLNVVTRTVRVTHGGLP